MNRNHIYAGTNTKVDTHNLKLILNQKQEIKHLKLKNKVLSLKVNGDEDQGDYRMQSEQTIDFYRQ